MLPVTLTPMPDGDGEGQRQHVVFDLDERPVACVQVFGTKRALH